jgi:DNA-binding transcriptional MerR regulator
MTDKIYKQKEFAQLIKVSERTLVRWDEEGKFKARKNPSGHRFYTEGDLKRYVEGRDTFFSEVEALQVLLEFSQDDRDKGRVISSKEFFNRLQTRKEKLNKEEMYINDTEYLQDSDSNHSERLKEAIEKAETGEVLELSSEDAIAFIEGLEAPATINKNFLKAAIRHKKVLGK